MTTLLALLKPRSDRDQICGALFCRRPNTRQKNLNTCNPAIANTVAAIIKTVARIIHVRVMIS